MDWIPGRHRRRRQRPDRARKNARRAGQAGQASDSTTDSGVRWLSTRGERGRHRWPAGGRWRCVSAWGGCRGADGRSRPGCRAARRRDPAVAQHLAHHRIGQIVRHAVADLTRHRIALQDPVVAVQPSPARLIGAQIRRVEVVRQADAQLVEHIVARVDRVADGDEPLGEGAQDSKIVDLVRGAEVRRPDRRRQHHHPDRPAGPQRRGREVG